MIEFCTTLTTAAPTPSQATLQAANGLKLLDLVAQQLLCAEGSDGSADADVAEAWATWGERDGDMMEWDGDMRGCFKQKALQNMWCQQEPPIRSLDLGNCIITGDSPIVRVLLGGEGESSSPDRANPSSLRRSQQVRHPRRKNTRLIGPEVLVTQALLAQSRAHFPSASFFGFGGLGGKRCFASTGTLCQRPPPLTDDRCGAIPYPPVQDQQCVGLGGGERLDSLFHHLVCSCLSLQQTHPEESP